MKKLSLQFLLEQKAPSLEEFSNIVKNLSKSRTVEKFGNNLVFINSLWEFINRMAHEPIGEKGPFFLERFKDVDLEEFKKMLIQASKKGLIELARADMVQAMDPSEVKKSEIQMPGFMGGEGPVFHFVRI